jgi:hypothetical protein
MTGIGPGAAATAPDPCVIAETTITIKRVNIVFRYNLNPRAGIPSTAQKTFSKVRKVPFPWKIEAAAAPAAAVFD